MIIAVKSNTMKYLLTRKHLYYISLIWIVVVSGLLWWAKSFFFDQSKALWDQQQAQSMTTKDFIDNFVAAVSSDKSHSSDTRKGVVQKYCDVVGKRVLQNNTTWFQHFIPTKSLFLDSICEYVWMPLAEERISYANARIQWTLESLAKSWRFWNCRVDGTMNDCYVGAFFQEIYNQIQNDYSNLKLMSIYSYIKGEGSVEDAIKQFSEKYFWSGASVCWSDSLSYLNPTEVEDKWSLCSHPKTYQELKKSFENAKDLANKIKYINVTDIYQDAQNSCNVQNPDFVKCAFTQGEPSWQAYKTLTYNELIFYQLFIQYYTFEILDGSKNPTQFFVDMGDSYDALDSEITNLSTQISVSNKALDNSIEILRNVAYTFPIHIALLAYYEDVIKLRRVMVQIYTPIHQLYYKLLNVQDLSR